MKYTDFKSYFQSFLLFSLREIKKKYPGFDRRRLSEWQEKDYIQKIIKGYYIFSDLERGEMALFLVANRMYDPSYVSFEMALSYYHLIPEGVYSVTSATTKKTATFQTKIAHFAYHKIKPPLMFGYQLLKYGDHEIKIAEMEKALLDFFYIHPELVTENDFAELRLNTSLLITQLKKEKLIAYLEIYGEKKLSLRIHNFLTFIEHAQS